MKRLLALVVLAVSATSCADEPTAPLRFPEKRVASIANVGDSIPGHYIVRLRDDVARPEALGTEIVARFGGRVNAVYRHSIRGFAAELPDAAVLALRSDPQVIRVVPDRRGGIAGEQSNPPSWGLDRVDQRNLPLDNRYAYANTGTQVRVYIIDTGIRPSHSDFGGRAYIAADFTGGSGDDCHGHGTHVAGTAGGTTYGVAKGVTLYGVRVLNCAGGGSASQAISAVDYVTGQKYDHPNIPMVANMSVHYGYVQDLNDAVDRSSAAGVTYAVAAANDALDACNDSPGSASTAITVAASDQNDNWAGFSNYGPCVELAAPGVAIVSAYYRHDTDTFTMTGTSMASPHVAGAAARYLQDYPSSAPSVVRQAIVDQATSGVLIGVPGSTVNKLLWIDPTQRLEMQLNGPATVLEEGYVTWEAVATGGSGGYTYQWTVYWWRTGVTESLGTSAIQSLYITADHGSFDISVTVTSGTESVWDLRPVCNLIPPNGSWCGP